MGCFSHTLNRVGEKFVTPILDDFVRCWISLFSRSPKTGLAWKTRTNLPVPTYSTTRWWSKWEVIKQMHDVFGDIAPFLEEESLAPTHSRLLDILNDPSKCRKLQIELAVVVDAGEPFVKSTYRLEGDGPLVLAAYEEISSLRAAISTAFYPNTDAVARKLSSNPGRNQMLTAYAKTCVQPAYDYFEEKFSNDLTVTLSAFKYACYFDPVKIGELKPSAADLDNLKVFKFLAGDGQIDGLKAELPRYMALADGVSTVVNKIEWWRNHTEELPKWSSACKLILLIQPSSAAAERVFSLLSSSFKEQQANSLEDYIETSIMLQYNYR